MKLVDAHPTKSNAPSLIAPKTNRPLSTLLGIGAELAAPASRSDGNRIVIAGRESAQETVNQVGQEITKRNVSIQPTLTIRPGFPVRVMVSRDLVLRPYQPLFLQRGASK